jgi:hypothetical protein
MAASTLGFARFITPETQHDQSQYFLSQLPRSEVRHGVLHDEAHADGDEEDSRLQRHSRRAGLERRGIAVGYLLFDSAEAFQSGFAPHAPEILADVPNYTNTQPTLQISQITL